jgi:hypothetical protein
MKKVVADTNVLVSATFWNGDSNRIIEKAELKEIELIISKEIVEEFSGVLGYKEIQDKIKNKNLEMRRTVEKIISISTIVEPQERFQIIKEDPDDDKFLDCAVAGKADVIISWNKHLLNLKEFKGIKIVRPDEFLREQY